MHSLTKEEKINKIVELATNPEFEGMIKSAVRTYLSITKRIAAAEDAILFYQNKIEDCEKKIEKAKIDATGLKGQLDQLFNKSVSNSFSSDIYALGITLQNEFKFNLADLGLAEMLSDDPLKRPGLSEVIAIIQASLDKLSKKELANSADVAKVNKEEIDAEEIDPTFRLPKKVTPDTLHENPNGKPLLLNKEQMDKLAEIKAEKSNQYVKIDNLTVFLSKEGGAFALHSPISQGANGSTFLGQNLQTGDWVALKVVTGNMRKIAAQVTALNQENKALTDMGQLQGTLNIDRGNNQAIYVSIQPFVHGKEYHDVMKNKDLPVESVTLMAMKALEAITKLQENDNYLHRDIKPENMLWDEKTNTCTIIDFGCAAKGAEVQQSDIQDDDNLSIPF